MKFGYISAHYKDILRKIIQKYVTTDMIINIFPLHFLGFHTGFEKLTY